MGGKDSKFSIITYEDAVKRITSDELQRLSDTFKRHSGNSNVSSKNVFCSEIFGELVPSRLLEQLYVKCGGNSKGISFREVVVLLVLITNGTLNERVRFLFHIISVDGNNITHDDLENFYFASDGTTNSPPKCITEAFWRSDKLSYDDFYQWVVANSDFSTATHWVLEEQQSSNGIRITNECSTESFYCSLANLTKLNEEDVIDLEKHYWSLKSASTAGKFDLQTFKYHVCPPLPEQFSESAFRFFDKNNDGHIDFKELVCGISLCCRGSNTERLRVCFEIFDIDRDNYLCDDDLINMVAGLFEIVQSYDPKLDINASREQFMTNFDFRENEKLGLDDFQHWAYTNTHVYEFLLLLSQICHIIFGLCPLFKKEEGTIIRRWIERESIRGLQFGSLYYIVSIEWWDVWKKYVSYDMTGTPNVQMIKKRNSEDSCDSWFDEILVTPSTNGSTSKSSCDMISTNGSYSKSCDTPLEGNENHFSFDAEPSLKSHNIMHMSSRNLNSTPTPPGMINNAGLLEPNDNRKLMVLTGEGGKLKRDSVLIYGKNYEVVPEPIWKALASWYEADVALPRTVVVEKGDREPELELYPIQIDFYRHSQPIKGAGFNMGVMGINNVMTQLYGNIVGNLPNTTTDQSNAVVTPKRTLQYRGSFSRKNTVRQIVDFLSQRLKINVEDLRLWVMEDEGEIILLEEENSVVGEICPNIGGKLLIEVRNRDLSWPEEMNSLVTTRNFRERSNTGPLEKGATGLHNLGNTCFMNSAVQCLSNTKPLTRYFSQKLFEYELNKVNPLGMKGVLAKRYGDLIGDLWSGIYRSIAPVKLRCTLGRYAPRFNGFQQHDSQEFLSFLLDGLHEDVNRVHDKPYVELKDSGGRPDSIVALEAWDNHIKRNQSIIVDLFQGQLKSQVRCLHCNHCSVTFDPFTFLSLPLPMESSIHLEIPVFTCDGGQAKRYSVLLSQTSTVKTLKNKLASLCLVPAGRLLLAEIGGPNITKLLLDDMKIHQNLSGCIFVYALEYAVTGLPLCTASTENGHKNHINSHDVTQANGRDPKSSGSTVFTNIGCYTNSLDKTSSNNSFIEDEETPTMTRSSKASLDISNTNPTFCNSNSSSVVEVASNSSNHNTVESMTSLTCSSPHGFLTILHRKMIQSNHYFLSWQKFRPSLFGIPFIISYENNMTNKELYDKVWLHVRKYVTGVTLSNSTEKRYPFDIKHVDKDGCYCTFCPWYKFCRGCVVEYNDSPFDLSGTHVAIDWDSTTLHLHYQQSQEKNFIDDISVEENLRLVREPISLDQCLKDFTKEEELGKDETWYCSACKEHRTIAKKLDIWKLPPVLVIHLKRFQAVNNRWIKSNKLVRFPTTMFDPSRYVAKGNLKRRDSSYQSSNDELESERSNNKPNNSTSKTSSTDSSQPSESGISFSNIAVDVPCENESEIFTIDSANSSCSDSIDDDYVYSLYAISCHSGMLNGGHYITYAKNPNGKWYCYNDSSCKDVDILLIEKESPYMLFFERKSLHTEDYMPNVNDMEAVNIQMEEEEFEKEVKKYCCVM